MKKYTRLPIPEDSAWCRKTYNPFRLLRRWVYSKWRYGWVDLTLDNIFGFISNINNGISNFWKWKKIIWKDRNWDDHYIFEILKHKLILQRKYLIEANRHMSIPETNRDITLCLNLIELIQEEYYSSEYLDYRESNFRFEPTGKQYEGQNTYELKDDLISERYDEYLSKYKSSVRNILKNGYRGLEIEDDDKGRLCLYVGQYNQEKCQKLLFRILSEKITHWWD
jgi:hypothetical protein